MGLHIEWVMKLSKKIIFIVLFLLFSLTSSFFVYALSCGDVATTDDPQIEAFLTLNCISEEVNPSAAVQEPLNEIPYIPLEDLEPSSEELEKRFVEYKFSLEKNTEIIVRPVSSEIVTDADVSSFTWIWFVGGGLLLFGIFICLIIKRVEHSENAYRQQQAQLKSYVVNLHEQGYSLDSIKNALQKRNYSPQTIAMVLAQL